LPCTLPGSRDAVIWKLALDDLDFVQSVNLRGAFLLIRHTLPLMRARAGGPIVLIGSINGSRGKFGTSAYSASKAGLLGLAKTVARETGRFGVLINVIEPGWVRTPLTEPLPQTIRDAALAESLVGAFVEPEDIGHAITSLAARAEDILRDGSCELMADNSWAQPSFSGGTHDEFQFPSLREMWTCHGRAR